jgi:hypothetical protein
MSLFHDSGVRDHTTILLGAGASAGSGLPDWNTLARNLLTGSGSVADDATANLLVKEQDPLLAVQAARVAYGDQWEPQIRKTLYRGVHGEQPSSLHLAAVGHLLNGNGTDTSLATLNFDVLLERAIRNETGTVAYSAADGHATKHRYRVDHLHGVASRLKSNAVVLTLSDFTELIANPRSWQLDYLSRAVSRGALIIAGTSYRDPDLRQWLHAAIDEHSSTNGALVMLAREGFGLTKQQFIGVERALGDQWRAIGLQSILLQDHSDAAQIIRELRHVGNANYESPQERARSVWAAHAAEFDRLQASYANQLDSDANGLADALGTTRLNLSLWLANGEGTLARWASHDRLHRKVDSLSTVETGHDSPSFAGKALSAEGLLIHDLDATSARQWRSVLSLTIGVPHPELPALQTAALTVGLPGEAAAYASSRSDWGQRMMEIAEEWGDRLAEATYGS